MYHDMDDGSGAAWWWMLPAMFVFLAAVVAVVWAVVVVSRPHGDAAPKPLTPEEVLAHRLATARSTRPSTASVSRRCVRWRVNSRASSGVVAGSSHRASDSRDRFNSARSEGVEPPTF